MLLLSRLLSGALAARCQRAFALFRRGGQGRDRTADLPLFRRIGRIADDRCMSPEMALACNNRRPTWRRVAREPRTLAPESGSRPIPRPMRHRTWIGDRRFDLILRIDRSNFQVMRSAAPALLPIFRSRLQAEILTALLLDPEREYSITDLARRFDAAVSTVHGEIGRLVEAGLLQRRNAGRSAMVRANPANRIVRPLTELMFRTWGPTQVIAEEFSGLPGAERVLIFGSWAARYLDWPGPPPNDLDVLVVGHPARSAVYDAADRAQQRLAMPVNPVIRPGSAWRAAADPLVRQIQAGPLVAVLEPDEAVRDSAEKAEASDG